MKSMCKSLRWSIKTANGKEGQTNFNKKELDREHATVIPFERHPGEVIFTNAERVLFHTTPPVEYVEEVMDDKDYKEDDEVISIESDSSAAESMLDDDFEPLTPWCSMHLW